MTVFVLDTDADRYQSVGLSNEDDWDALLDLFDGTSIKKNWKALEVEVVRESPTDDDLLPSDFPTLDGVIPIFSAKAVTALRPLLLANGELLPLRSKQGAFTAYNVTRLSDALDEGRSKLSYFRGSADLMGVARAAFVPEKLVGLTIFKVRQDPRGDIYVTDDFVKSVREAGLAGFDFKQVWPWKERRGRAKSKKSADK